MHPRLVVALRHEPVDRPPFWYMRQAGRYLPEYRAVREQAGSFLELCYDPARAAEVTLQPVRRFGTDAAILFADILLVPDALGQPVSFHEGEGPRLAPIRSRGDLSSLDGSRVSQHLEPVFETVRRVRAELAPEVALIGFAGAPWTVATYMVEGRGSPDQAAAKAWSYADPDGFEALMALLIEASCDYLLGQIAAGADVLQLFDTWAGALAAPMFERWCLAPTRAIVQRIKRDHPEVPIIGFPRGIGAQLERYVRETGVDGIGIDTAVPTGWAARHLQPLTTVQGNLDPLAVLAGGAAMRQAASRIVADLRAGPFIFNLGHGFVPATPPDHVAALSAWLRSGAEAWAET